MLRHRSFLHRLPAAGVCVLVVCAATTGCLPSRWRGGALFASDPVCPPVVRVLLSIDGPTSRIEGDSRYVVCAIHSRGATETYSTEDPITLRHNTEGWSVTGRPRTPLTRGATGVIVYPEDRKGKLRIEKSPYSGALLFGADPDGRPQVINRLNLDDYLEGVLRPELGERSPDEFEAVKAQAVASRTYALAHLGQYGSAPYDLRADVADQVYVGAAESRTWVEEAVAATRGEAILHAGHLIDAYYHSTCGGHTDAIEDIWPKRPRPYLVSVDDDTFCQWSKYTTWTETFGGRTLLTNLRTYRRQLRPAPIGDFKTIDDIELVPGTPGGRLAAMVVVTPAGRWTIRADQIRWALGRPSRPGTILPSSRFTLALKRDKHGHVTGATANGSGYGHGVGMCQCGMIGRARAGQKHVEILTTYYPSTSVVRIY